MAPALIDMAALCSDWRVVKPTNKELNSMSEKTGKDILDNNDTRHEVYGCAKQENQAAS